MEELINYAKSFNADKEVIVWIENNAKGKPQGEVEHIIDYLIQTKRDFSKDSYNRINKRAKEWLLKLNKKGDAIKEIEGRDIEVIKKWRSGFKFVKLISENAYKREGFLMGHCVGSYYDKKETIYSLRDKDNKPHATISSHSMQIKGYGNGSIHPRYVKYTVEILEELGLNVRDSEMLNLGYLNVEKFKKYLSPTTKKNLFKNKYHYMKEKLLSKDNEEFLCLDLLDTTPLISENKNGLKLNYDIAKFVEKSCEFIRCIKGDEENVSTSDSSGNNTKIISSGFDSQLASSENNTKMAFSGSHLQIASSGDHTKIASSGNNTKIASSGFYLQLASSGFFSQLASSGFDSQLASSGFYSQLASSGGRTKIASSGNNTKIASSGFYLQLASSGFDSQLASSGDHTKIASSGNNTKIASSGDYSTISCIGQKSVCVNIGFEGRIMGIKGTWITLAEYSPSGELKYVKTGKIDGIKLKENTFYKLKNKKFVEA